MISEKDVTRPGLKPKLPKTNITRPRPNPTLSEAKINRWKTGRIKPVRFALASDTSNLPASVMRSLEQPTPDMPLVLPPVGTIVDWAEMNQCWAALDPTVTDGSRLIVGATGILRESLLDAKLESSGWVPDACLDDQGKPCGALVIEVVEAVVGTNMGGTRDFTKARVVDFPTQFGGPCDYIVFYGWEPGTLATPPPRKTMRRIRITL